MVFTAPQTWKTCHPYLSIEFTRTYIEAFLVVMEPSLISKLEKLARLRLSDQERSQFAADLNRILSMIDTLQQLDTKGVEPLVYLNDAGNVHREDQWCDSGTLSTEQALQNAPDHDGKYFRVPKMIE